MYYILRFILRQHLNKFSYVCFIKSFSIFELIQEVEHLFAETTLISH